VVLQVLVDVEGVEVLRVEAGEEHVHYDGDIDLLGALLGEVGVGKLLVLDALLDVLIVEVELADGVVAAVAGVIVGDNGLESGLLAVGIVLIVFLLCGQVFLKLPHVGVTVGGRGEDAGDLERNEHWVGGLPLGLDGLEEAVILDGVVNRGGGEESVEAAGVGGGVVLG